MFQYQCICQIHLGNEKCWERPTRKSDFRTRAEEEEKHQKWSVNLDVGNYFMCPAVVFTGIEKWYVPTVTFPFFFLGKIRNPTQLDLTCPRMMLLVSFEFWFWCQSKDFRCTSSNPLWFNIRITDLNKTYLNRLRTRMHFDSTTASFLISVEMMEKDLLSFGIPFVDYFRYFNDSVCGGLNSRKKPFHSIAVNNWRTYPYYVRHAS